VFKISPIIVSSLCLALFFTNCSSNKSKRGDFKIVEKEFDSSKPASCHIIRNIELNHCDQGPTYCEICIENAPAKYTLLDICPQDFSLDRRQIDLGDEHEAVIVEYEIIRVFDSPQNAQLFADENGLFDIEIKEEL
jgi:hypothetical protein